MKQAKILLRTFIAILGMTSVTMANNITVSSVSYNQALGTVTFSISWENGWRLAGGQHDAAWVFVKFRDCASSFTGTQFTHGLMNTIYASHTFPAGIEAVQTTGGNANVGIVTGIDGAPNNTGVMLRRTSTGTGSFSATGITLQLTNMPAAGTLDFRIFAIEMVYIPFSSYYAGDGNGTAGGNQAFATSLSSKTPYFFSSEAAQTVFADGFASYALTAPYPKGYDSYYMMKYEASEEQFVNFLNALPTGFYGPLAVYTGIGNRHTITNPATYPNFYVTARPNRVYQLNSTWRQLTSYLDWAGLRPMTEFQYEKAARGPLVPLLYEYAWGSTAFTTATTISGVENGTETITTVNANINAWGGGFTGGDGGAGALRPGIFATPLTSTRQQTGGSYYGVMELSGNAWECCISVNAGILGQISATGVSLGDGMLSLGDHNVANWPAAAGTLNGTITRGGYWGTSPFNNTSVNVSFRPGLVSAAGGGIRGVR